MCDEFYEKSSELSITAIIESIESGLKDNPGDADLRSQLAEALHYAGRLEEAIIIYTELLESGYQLPDADIHHALANLLYRQAERDNRLCTNYEAIMGLYRIGNLVSPHFAARGHLDMARILRKCGRFEESACEYREALTLKPYTDRELEYAQMLSETGQHAEALPIFRKHSSKLRSWDSLYYYYIQTLKATGHNEEADALLFDIRISPPPLPKDSRNSP